MDECSQQLMGEVREPLPPKPVHVAKQDSEYERRGTAHVFRAVEPLAGQRLRASDLSIGAWCALDHHRR